MPTLSELFRLDPDVERLTLLPRFRGSLPSDPGYVTRGSVMGGDRYMPDIIAPKVIADFIRAVKAPAKAARGEAMDEEEALNFALNLTGGGLATSGKLPEGSLGMGARVGGKTIRELLYGDKPELTPAEKSAMTRFERELKVPAVRRREEMRASGAGNIVTPTEGMTLIKEIGLSPESLVDKRIVPVLGDLSTVGGTVRQIAGVPLDKPVLQQGGRRYSLIEPNVKQEIAWASEPAAASSKAANLSKYPEEDVLGIFVGMGPESINFSHHIAEGMLNQLPAISPSKDAIKQLNQAVRQSWVKDQEGNRRYPFANFAGIDSPNIRELISKGTDEFAPGALRTVLAEKMSDAKFRNMGFPRWEDVMSVMSEPGLRQGYGGQTIFQAIPGETVIPDFSHGSYSRGIKGKYVGGLMAPSGQIVGAPVELLMPKTFERMRAMGKKDPQIMRSLQMSHHGEKFTEEALDPLIQFLRSQ